MKLVKKIFYLALLMEMGSLNIIYLFIYNFSIFNLKS